MEIRFLEEASADIRRLHKFIHRINPRAALDAIHAIIESVHLLAQSPELGVRFDRVSGLRRWTVRFGRNGYVVEYFVEGDTLFISRIWHSREER